MEHIQQDISLSRFTDLANLRYISRTMLQELHASLREQTRVSWLIDYLARQILSYDGSGDISLKVVENEDDKTGLQISCRGEWLNVMGVLYKHHIIPMANKSDTIEYLPGSPPTLMIIAWV